MVELQAALFLFVLLLPILFLGLLFVDDTLKLLNNFLISERHLVEILVRFLLLLLQVLV